MAPASVRRDDGYVDDAQADEVDRPSDDPDELTFRFDDGYWDDAFGTLYDPTMRVCSVFGGC